MEQEMATHSSILAWEIPWTEDPGRWQSMGSQELGIIEQTEKPQTTATAPEEQLIGWLVANDV